MLFITAGPSTKLFAWGEGESGGHVWSYGTVSPITSPFEDFLGFSVPRRRRSVSLSCDTKAEESHLHLRRNPGAKKC
jgi:hypothetical protein